MKNEILEEMIENIWNILDIKNNEELKQKALAYENEWLSTDIREDSTIEEIKEYLWEEYLRLKKELEK